MQFFFVRGCLYIIYSYSNSLLFRWIWGKPGKPTTQKDGSFKSCKTDAGRDDSGLGVLSQKGLTAGWLLELEYWSKWLSPCSLRKRTLDFGAPWKIAKQHLFGFSSPLTPWHLLLATFWLLGLFRLQHQHCKRPRLGEFHRMGDEIPTNGKC